MQAFVKQLHSSKQYWVPIVDPGIKVDPGYPAYDQGLAAKAFINDFTGKPYLGQVGLALPASLPHLLWIMQSCMPVLQIACLCCVGLALTLLKMTLHAPLCCLWQLLSFGRSL